MKLSKRLTTLNQLVSSDYTHIWDCCCDHGSLGMSLLARQAAPNIHFVDIVPELIHNINLKLTQFFINSASTWFTHSLDIAKLPLHRYLGKHLIIIAGVGGDLTIQFIQQIHRQYPHLAIDFLLCPVHHQFALRQQLIQLDFRLKQEVLVEEKRRFYEVLLVSSQQDSSRKISAVGEGIWHANSVQQAKVITDYLTTTIQHYQRIDRGNPGSSTHIVNAYHRISHQIITEHYSSTITDQPAQAN